MSEDDDQPEDTGLFAGDTPHARLWREARAWVANLFVMADDLRHLARTGIARAAGRRLGLFVFSIEAAVRRLVLMLALQLTPAPSPPSKGKSAPRPALEPETPKPIRVFFRLFATAGGSAGVQREPPAFQRLGPVIAVGRDPLLSLGQARPRRQKTRSSHACWRTLPDPQYEAIRGMFEMRGPREGAFFGLHREKRPPKPRNPPILRQDRPPVGARRGLPHDRLIPAPGLARRIAALSNILRDPMEFATRAARRIARLAGGADGLRGAPAPSPSVFRNDKRPSPATSMLREAHALFAGVHDTS